MGANRPRRGDIAKSAFRPLLPIGSDESISFWLFRRLGGRRERPLAAGGDGAHIAFTSKLCLRPRARAA
jgi:hypothetical protein